MYVHVIPSPRGTCHPNVQSMRRANNNEYINTENGIMFIKGARLLSLLRNTRPVSEKNICQGQKGDQGNSAICTVGIERPNKHNSCNHILSVASLGLHNPRPPERLGRGGRPADIQWKTKTRRVLRIRKLIGVLLPNLLQKLQARHVVHEPGILGDVLAPISDGSPVVFLDTFRAHDEQRPKKIHIGLCSAEAMHAKPYKVLNARVLRGQAGLCQAFTVQKCGVAEAFRNLINVPEILVCHVICRRRRRRGHKWRGVEVKCRGGWRLRGQ